HDCIYFFDLRRWADHFHRIRHDLDFFHRVAVRGRPHHIRSYRDLTSDDSGDLQIDLRRTDPLDLDPTWQAQEIGANTKRGGSRSHAAEVESDLFWMESVQQRARPLHSQVYRIS